MRLKLLLALGLVTAASLPLLVGSGARADWPTSRHDTKRTAIAPGTSNITKPTRYWQTYLGGSLRGNSHIALDVNKDGATDIVYVAGGKVIAKLPDDRLVWESTPVEISTLHGVMDLDGDGKLEIVAASSRNVFVLDGGTGAILWKEPDGEVGNVGGVRIADLDGDGHPEVLIDDCACCGISPTAASPGGVYKFETGKLGTPKRMYAPFARGHCGSGTVTVGDWDGDGATDVAWGNETSIIFTSGLTGAPLDTSAPLGQRIFYTTCESANVDGRPGDELICQEDYHLADGDVGGRRLFAVTFDAAASPKVKTLWNLEPVPKATGTMRYLTGSLVDLDGDGSIELTASWHDGTKWHTAVLDAKTGTEVIGFDGEVIRGVYDVDGDGKPEIVTTAGTGLVARKFARGDTPQLTTFSNVSANVSVVYAFDYTRAMRSAHATPPLAINLKGDGKSLPIWYTPGATGALARYAAYRFDAAGTPSAAATFEVPEGITLLTTQVYSKVNRAYPQLLVTRNDGYLLVLDDAFAATNGITYGTGEFKTVLPGMRVGGFTADPIAPRLDGSWDSVVVTDSRGVLMRLDGNDAWMAKGPKVAWELRGGSQPTTAAGIDAGKPGIVCTRGTQLTAVSGAGATLWNTTYAGGGTAIHDPLASDVNGDGAADVFATHMTGGAVVNHQVYDGKTGTPLWASPPSQALSWGYMPFSLADHDGDGVLDLFTVPNTLRVYDGKSGTKQAENTAFIAYFTPVIDDVDGDGVAEVTLSRGYYPAQTWKKDLTTIAWKGEDDRPYQHGARAACSGGRSVWVQPSSQYQGLVRFITMNGVDAGKSTSAWLASGTSFATAAAATAAGKFLGNLGNVAIKKDLLGTAAHPSALVGSSDGYLYALDPCAGAIDWAYDMRIAVGSPILADTSGDGVDEIIVPAADGYLYALGQRQLDPPAEVNDNDPFAPLPAPDVDEVTSGTSLGASWTAVTGADGYQIAVLTEGGSYVTQPDWVDVGAVTNTVLKNLSFVAGRKYFVAVRALSKTKGSSIETKSDGVIVRNLVQPDGGLGDVSLFEDSGTPVVPDAGVDAPVVAPDGGAPFAEPAAEEGGCGCRTTGRGADAAAVVAAALAMGALGTAFLRRRR